MSCSALHTSHLVEEALDTRVRSVHVVESATWDGVESIVVLGRWSPTKCHQKHRRAERRRRPLLCDASLGSDETQPGAKANRDGGNTSVSQQRISSDLNICPLYPRPFASSRRFLITRSGFLLERVASPEHEDGRRSQHTRRRTYHCGGIRIRICRWEMMIEVASAVNAASRRLLYCLRSAVGVSPGTH
nr:hypothetical protein CFP56_28656 [Quercus suber]